MSDERSPWDAPEPDAPIEVVWPTVEALILTGLMFRAIAARRALRTARAALLGLLANRPRQ
jgi:hypothetical protein